MFLWLCVHPRWWLVPFSSHWSRQWKEFGSNSCGPLRTGNCSFKKGSLRADWLIAAVAYLGFCSMKQLGVFLLPLDGMLVHHRSLPRNLLGFPNNSPVPIYTHGWREALREFSVLPKNTTQCPRPGLAPRLLALGMNALTMRLPCLQKQIKTQNKDLRSVNSSYAWDHAAQELHLNGLVSMYSTATLPV